MDDNLNLAGVYEIVCSVNGKRYVGSTSESFRKRWGTHRRQLKDGSHHSRTLQRAWNKHGCGAFEFRIAEITLPKHAIAVEQTFLDWRKSYDPKHGYNICKDARSSLGVVRTEESRAKMSKAKFQMSNETKAKIGAKSKGRVQSIEARAKNAAKQKGKVITQETRFKIASSLRGRKYSDERIEAFRRGFAEAMKRRRLRNDKTKRMFDA